MDCPGKFATNTQCLYHTALDTTKTVIQILVVCLMECRLSYGWLSMIERSEFRRTKFSLEREREGERELAISERLLSI